MSTPQVASSSNAGTAQDVIAAINARKSATAMATPLAAPSSRPTNNTFSTSTTPLQKQSPPSNATRTFTGPPLDATVTSSSTPNNGTTTTETLYGTPLPSPSKSKPISQLATPINPTYIMQKEGLVDRTIPVPQNANPKMATSFAPAQQALPNAATPPQNPPTAPIQTQVPPPHQANVTIATYLLPQLKKQPSPPSSNADDQIVYVDLTLPHHASSMHIEEEEEDDDDDEDIILTPELLAKLAQAGVFGTPQPIQPPHQHRPHARGPPPRRGNPRNAGRPMRQRGRIVRNDPNTMWATWTAYPEGQGQPQHARAPQAPPPIVNNDGTTNYQMPVGSPPNIATPSNQTYSDNVAQHTETRSSRHAHHHQQEQQWYQEPDPEPWLSDPHLVALAESAKLAAQHAAAYRAFWEDMRTREKAHLWTDDERIYIGKKCNEYVDMADRFDKKYAQEVTKFKDVFLAERELLKFAKERTSYYEKHSAIFSAQTDEAEELRRMFGRVDEEWHKNLQFATEAKLMLMAAAASSATDNMPYFNGYSDSGFQQQMY